MNKDVHHRVQLNGRAHHPSTPMPLAHRTGCKGAGSNYTYIPYAVILLYLYAGLTVIAGIFPNIYFPFNPVNENVRDPQQPTS